MDVSPHPDPLNEITIPAEQRLPEITVKAFILSIILTIILAAANAYLGLRVGLTISASIPAAVISMGILRLFKKSNILENNIVQTAASAGEALTAGMVFTLPALIVLHYWSDFAYWPTVIIAMLGGILGVLCSIPLRRVLLADKTLAFPEGTAIGNILRASTLEESGTKNIILGGTLGAFISLCQTGFKLLAEDIQAWFVFRGTVFGGGLGFSTALLGAGFIIGPVVCISIFIGVILGWIIGIPVISWIYGIPLATTEITDVAMMLWSQYIRYIGLGVMMVGGIWAISILIKPLYFGMKASVDSVRLSSRRFRPTTVLRTERDIPFIFVAIGILLLLIPIYFVLNYITGNPLLGLSFPLQQAVNWASIVFFIIGGFALASVCAYFAGLIGSSASPLSSMALIALIVFSIMLSLILQDHIHLDVTNAQTTAAAAIAIIMTALVAATAGISLDTIQDLKSGQMVGATPWKQQVMLIVGVVVAAFVIPLILQLLFNAYGLAGVFPHPNMVTSQMLMAPQAQLMAAVVEGIFAKETNWVMLIIGGIIAICCMIIDKIIIRRGWRLPVLAVGLGIYLPLDTSTPLIMGGILSYFAQRSLARHYATCAPLERDENIAKGNQQGLLLACGLVAGSAIMGVLLAIPFVIEGTSNALRVVPKSVVIIPQVLSMLVIIGLCAWFVKQIKKLPQDLE